MDESAFLAAIAADPDDDGAWHVYADWLEDQGDPRAELLRLHLERSRASEHDPRRESIDARIAVLEESCREPCEAYGGLRRHGLMTSVGMTGEEFLESADDVFGRYPISGLTLTLIGGAGAARRIADSSHLSQLTMLGFVGRETAYDVERILRSDRLGGLRELVLRTASIAPVVLSVVRRLTHLRKLALVDCNLDADRARQLAADWPFEQLTELDLRGNPYLGEQVIRELAKAGEAAAVRLVRIEEYRRPETDVVQSILRPPIGLEWPDPVIRDDASPYPGSEFARERFRRPNGGPRDRRP